MRSPAASMTSPSVSGPPRPRRNPLPTERTTAPVRSTILSMPPVWSSCLWLISTSGIVPSSAMRAMCSSSSGPGSTITISSLPGPRSTQVLVPSSVIKPRVVAQQHRGGLGDRAQQPVRRMLERHCDLDDQLDLHRRVQRQLGHPDRGASVRARVAEHLAEQLRGPVDHARLAVESRRGCDEPDDLDHPGDGVDADQRMHRGKPVECARPRQRLALLGAHLAADLAGLRQLACLHRQLAGRVDQVAGAHRGHVGRHRRDDVGQLDAQLGEPFGGRSFRPLQIRDVLLARRARQHRDQLPAVLTPLVEDLLRRMRQQRDRGVLPAGSVRSCG